MANYTDNYDLILPNENENYDVQVANTNNIAIDRILKGKIDKIVGKDLSTNDFTNLYKKKLDALTMPYKYIGTVEEYEDLPSTSTNGYIYGVTETNTSYIWNETEWVDLDGFIDFSKIEEQIISDLYSNTKTYAVDDYCIYNNTLYKCITAVTTAENFDPTKWQATNIATELESRLEFELVEEFEEEE